MAYDSESDFDTLGHEEGTDLIAHESSTDELGPEAGRTSSATRKAPTS